MNRKTRSAILHSLRNETKPLDKPQPEPSQSAPPSEPASVVETNPAPDPAARAETHGILGESPDEQSLETLLAEAEHRGYIRARAEFARQQFSAPAAGDSADFPSSCQPDASDSCLFLGKPRRSVWDL